MFITLNDTSKKLLFFMADVNDTSVGKTGLTLTVTRSKNGSSFVAATGSAGELSGGYYVFTLDAADVDTLGILAFLVSATGAVTYPVEHQVVAIDVYGAIGATAEEVALAVWTEELPGSYVEGTAGYLIGNPPAAGADMASFISEITEREHYFTTLHEKTIPSSFKHTPADNKPTPPAYPDALDEGAQAEVVAWRMAGSNPDSSSTDYPTDTDAVDYVEAAVAYQAEIAAWKLADAEARIAQYDWVRADAAILNKPTMSESADDTGVGSDPPPEMIPPQPIHTFVP